MTASFFVLNLINSLAFIFVESKLLECKINFKDKKIYLVTFFLALSTVIIYFLTKSILKIAILFQIYNICHIYLYRSKENDTNKITFASVVCFIIYLLAEVIVAIGLSIILKTLEVDKINSATNSLIGYAIILAFLLLIIIKPIRKMFIKIINASYKSHYILFFIIYVLSILTTTLYIIYFDLSQILKLVLLILSLADYVFLTYFIIINYRNKEKIQKELNLMIEITSKYEEIINNSRIRNHENKNQLIVIKDLVSDNRKASDYIDTILNNKYDDDENLFIKVAKIPSGGLKGFIYYKLLTMKSKGIHCHIEVSRGINKKILSNLNIDLVQSFYKIIGVFVDNAIEAVENEKEKLILIELYKNKENLIFSVSNEYKGKIDFEQLGKKRLTSKNGYRGYGLQLVDDLVNRYNDDIFHQFEVVGNLFVQKVGIKIKG